MKRTESGVVYISPPSSPFINTSPLEISSGKKLCLRDLKMNADGDLAAWKVDLGSTGAMP